MAITFNADEVLAMAEGIEANGAAFYRKAAQMHKSHSEFLLKLARMEDQHKQYFADMRKALPLEMMEDTAFDPYLEAELYLKEAADSHKGEGSSVVTAALTGKERMDTILLTAIQLEEKSIAFYVGLKDMVPKKLGKDKVDDIINEEKRHVVTLAGELRKVQAS